MREIKFRAWDYKTKTMWEVKDLSWCDPCFIVANPGLEHMDIQDRDFRTKRVPNDIELMQYTGLLDKQGKEIYEGDIVKTDEAGWVAQVIYRRDYFMLTGLDNRGFSVECNWENFVVIGNIYENPELLK